MSEVRGPFFCYYGGKWRAAGSLYPAPRHGLLVEPFAGSAGYALRHPHLNVALCERDPIVAAVWRYLIHVSADELLSIPDLPPGESVDDLRVCQEARWLVGFWLNKGVSRPRKSPSKWMRSGIRPGSFWGQRVRVQLARQLESIRHWRVREGSYQDCSEIGEATWFIDPPYEAAGKHYAYGSDEIDYPALALWCRSRRGQVIVCENEGASWLPFSPLAHTKATRSKRSAEALWVSEAA